VIVFPAIDLLGGRVVRLAQGDYDRVTVYSDDPADQAAWWLECGAEWIHVVDLDGARDGVPANTEVIERIVRETGARIQTGGGIRSMATLERLFGAGVERAVLGTKLVADPELVREAVERFGEGMVAGVDARDGWVQIEGWREGTRVPEDELIGELADLGVRHLVYTDISRDGMRTGISASTYVEVAATAGFPVVASGGVSSVADVRALAALGDRVIEGLIIGRALYEGSIDLREALAVAAGTGSAGDTPARETGAPSAAEGPGA
jgi:phosphoribosylformimino-5-aminoimidazole carboxamide ribotide isomerase